MQRFPNLNSRGPVRQRPAKPPSIGESQPCNIAGLASNGLHTYDRRRKTSNSPAMDPNEGNQAPDGPDVKKMNDVRAVCPSSSHLPPSAPTPDPQPDFRSALAPSSDVWLSPTSLRQLPSSFRHLSRSTHTRRMGYLCRETHVASTINKLITSRLTMAMSVVNRGHII